MKNVKEAIKTEMKDMFKLIRINSIEYVDQYMKGMHDIILYKADVTVVDFLDRKFRETILVKYDPALAGGEYRQEVIADELYAHLIGC